jgi:hypothetical protein
MGKETMQMQSVKWLNQEVYGRDEVLLDIEKRANAHSATVLEDARAIMCDYEVDMYRLVIGIGNHLGIDKAYEIMSDTVAEKRLSWLDQVSDELELSGTAVEKGLALYLMYFKPKESDFKIIEKNDRRIIFKRKDFVNAISYACDVLGLDVIEVNNKVYARAMNLMFQRINLNLRHIFLDYQDGWYGEMIEEGQ